MESEMVRLETVDPQLARELAEAEPTALRQVAIAVAEYALEQTGLHNPVTDSALRELRDETNDEKARSGLASLVEELDERGWNIQDRVEEGTASQQEYLDAFSQARAAAALEAAFDANPVTAAQEAAYEAVAAVDDVDEIRRIAHEQLAK